MGTGAKIPRSGVRADMDGLRAWLLFGCNMYLILWLGIGLLKRTKLFLGLNLSTYINTSWS